VNPHFLRQTASYDVVSNSWQALWRGGGGGGGAGGHAAAEEEGEPPLDTSQMLDSLAAAEAAR
jgi:hypothetical protein